MRAIVRVLRLPVATFTLQLEEVSVNGLAIELDRCRRELKARRRAARFAAHSHKARHLSRKNHEVDRLERATEELEHADAHTDRRQQ